MPWLSNYGCFFALCTNIEYVYSSVVEKQQTFSLFDKIHKEKNKNDYVLVFSSTEPALEYWGIVNKKKIEYDIISRDLFREQNIDIENIESCLSEGFFLHDKIFVVYSHRYYEKASNIMKEIFTRHGYKVETENAKGAILQKAVRIS